MSLPKLLLTLSFLLFVAIFAASYIKGDKKKQEVQQPKTFVESVPLDLSVPEEPEEEPPAPPENIHDLKQEEGVIPHAETRSDVDRIAEFFNKKEPRLPIVETIVYKSHVPWLKGKSAWVADYATHYRTSRHFIARSLNGKPDYDKQDVKDGDRFNILRPEKKIEFYLLAQLSTGRLWFYYVDGDTQEKVLLKSYPICVGRPDPESASGSLTPVGKYRLGDKIAIYRPKVRGMYQGQKIEMVSVFGTRWIPFVEEKGLGLHGLPLQPNAQGTLEEDVASLGTWSSDGCIRLATKDIEELFAIIITRPTTIELVP